MSNAELSAEDVAQWMLKQIAEKGEILQEDVAWQLERRFGKKFVYYNDRGNTAISKEVLQSFRKLSGDSVVWSKRERCWRKRHASDGPGRQQE